jgi:type VI secretion system secreted protein VgrG
MGQITQDSHLISISDFSLGKDTFLLTSFEGLEYISDLFEFDIEVLSANLSVKPESVVGKPVTVTVQNVEKGSERAFHGYVRSLAVGEVVEHGLRQYKMVMVPWLWFLTQTNNYRIFQNVTTKEVVSTLFDDLGFNDYVFRNGEGAKRDYCVQHDESDFNFISRLLEEEGISYYFEHSKDCHRLVLSEGDAHPDLPETDLEYSKGTSPHAQISAWEHSYSFRKGVWSLKDYNFEEPQKPLLSSAPTKSKFASNAKYKHYEYPGLYKSTEGDKLVKIRLEAEETECDTVSGQSNCGSFHAGGKFCLGAHESSDERGGYIVVAVKHVAKDPTHTTGSKGSPSYQNHFFGIPEDVRYRPALRHKKPVVGGPVSAVVVGPDDEEIHIDDYGRIKARFHWQRSGEKADDTDTCWLRVVQSWAGNQWGASFIPRIGHEVIVNFLNGDPDRPLVTGSVYNGKNKPVYSSKTQSGIKTRSTKGGDGQNFNELRFDDKKDAEQIYLHAEKDFDTQVENNQTLTVDNDRTKSVGNDENSTIKNDRNKTVSKNETESIGKNKTIDVGENHSETIGKDMSLSVGKNVSIDIGENHTETVGKDMTVTVSGDLKESVSGKHVESVTKEYGLKAKSIILQADDQITLKTGSASIVMKKNGDITISGKNINVKGSGNVVLKGSKVTSN